MKQPMREQIRLSFVSALIFILITPTLWAQTDELGKSFKDEFFHLDKDRWFLSDGWRNGKYQNCLWNADQVTVANGKLVIAFNPSSGGQLKYECGEIRTYQSYKYGLFEARIKTSRGSGLNAAFFTYIGPSDNKPHDEIDVEILTKNTNSVSFNTYVSGKPHHGAEKRLQNATHTAFKTYSILWTPNSVHWYVNGQLLHQTSGTKNLPKHPQKIFASLWGSDTKVDWMGEFRPINQPVTMEIDWIAYTSLDDTCQFRESVMCKLREK